MPVFRQWRESVSPGTKAARQGQHCANVGKMAQMISGKWASRLCRARAEVAKSAGLCDWYAEHGPAMLRAEPTLVETKNAVIEYRPLGLFLR